MVQPRESESQLTKEIDEAFILCVSRNLSSSNVFSKLGFLEYDFVVESLSRVRLFATPRTAARQASLSLTISWSLPKCMSIDWVSDAIQLPHLILLPAAFNRLFIQILGTASILQVMDTHRESLSISSDGMSSCLYLGIYRFLKPFWKKPSVFHLW